jgi:hypothetical protein
MINTTDMHIELSKIPRDTKAWWELYLTIKFIECPNIDREALKERSGYNEFLKETK